MIQPPHLGCLGLLVCPLLLPLLIRTPARCISALRQRLSSGHPGSRPKHTGSRSGSEHAGSRSGHSAGLLQLAPFSRRRPLLRRDLFVDPSRWLNSRRQVRRELLPSRGRLGGEVLYNSVYSSPGGVLYSSMVGVPLYRSMYSSSLHSLLHHLPLLLLPALLHVLLPLPLAALCIQLQGCKGEAVGLELLLWWWAIGAGAGGQQGRTLRLLDPLMGTRSGERSRSGPPSPLLPVLLLLLHPVLSLLHALLVARHLLLPPACILPLLMLQM